MKHSITILYFSLLGLTGIAQDTHSQDILIKKFIDDVFPNYFTQEIIVLKKLDSFTQNQIITCIDKSNLKRMIRTEKGKVKTEILNLSFSERHYIKSQLISDDKKWLTSNYHQPILVDQVDTAIIMQGKKIHNFSKPIFLKNDTLCIFYDDYICGGLCGQGYLSIYHIVDGKWKIFWSLYSWNS